MNLHFLLWIGAWFSSLAGATSFFIRPLPDFARDARYIVRGTLHSVVSEYGSDPAGAKTLYTYAKLEVREVLKGTLPEREILIRKVGGTKDGVTLSIDSSPEFSENEDTVLFLGEQKDDRSYEVEGLELGKFGLEERNGELFLKGGILSYSKPRPGEGSDAQGPGIAENRRDWPLRELRNIVGATEPVTQELRTSPPSEAATGSNAVSGNNAEHLNTASDDAAAPPQPQDPARIAGFLLVAAAVLVGGLFLYLRRR
jgi:hypothetical protein